MDKKDKIQEGQVQINDLDNYTPLDKPIVNETHTKVSRLISKLHRDNYIDDMTRKWLSQTPNPPRIPEFYTLTKIHKPTLVGRPIISGCSGPTERISAFVDTFLQPISISQASYFINFIEKTKVNKQTFLVSMDVTSLYTNIPQEEGIHAFNKSGRHLEFLINDVIRGKISTGNMATQDEPAVCTCTEVSFPFKSSVLL